MSEKFDDNDYPRNFAISFNEIILKGIIEKTNKNIIFIVRKIVNLDLKYYEYSDLIIPGDKLEIE